MFVCVCIDATCYYKLWLRRTPLQPICDQRNRENLGFSFAIFLFRPKSEVKRLAFSILHHRTQFFWGLFPINFFVYFFASLHSLRIIVKPLGITIPLTCPSTFYRSLAFSNGHTFFFRENYMHIQDPKSKLSFLFHSVLFISMLHSLLCVDDVAATSAYILCIYPSCSTFLCCPIWPWNGFLSLFTHPEKSR